MCYPFHLPHSLVVLISTRCFAPNFMIYSCQLLSYLFYCNSMGHPKGQPIFSIAAQWDNQRDNPSFLLRLNETTKGTTHLFYCDSLGQPKGQPIFSIATQWDNQRDNLSFLLRPYETTKGTTQSIQLVG